MFGKPYSLPPSSASRSDVSASPIRPVLSDARALRAKTSAADVLRSPSPLERPQIAQSAAAAFQSSAAAAPRPTGGFLRGDLSVAEQLDALKSALLVTMEELDSLRRDVTIENGKLQMEFRRSLDAVLEASEAAALSERSRPHDAALRPAAAGGMSLSGMREVASRLDYLEQSVAALRARQSTPTSVAVEHATAPAAVDAALRRMQEFMDRADAEMRSSEAHHAHTIDALEAHISRLQKEQLELKKQLEDRDHESRRRAHSPEKPRASATVSAPFVTLTQASNMVNANIVEVASLMDAEIAKINESVAALRQDRIQLGSKLDHVAETVSQLEKETREMQVDTSNHVATLTKTSATAELYLRRIEDFVEGFTLQESANIRDQVLALVNSDAAIKQRKIDERVRNDELAAAKQDMIRTIAALERVQDEVRRVTAQNDALERAFQVSEHAAQSMQHKVDTELRSIEARVLQQLKVSSSRHEQQLQSDRHAMLLKLQEELSRAQEKHATETSLALQSRLDELQQTSSLIRDDFSSFVEAQRREMASIVSKLKEDYNGAVKLANEHLSRSMNTSRDEQRRTADRVVEDTRKLAAQTAEELRRTQALVDDISAKVQDRLTFTEQRVNQLVEHAETRIESTSSDVKAQLVSLVEREVRSVISTTMKAAERSINTLAETTTRALALQKEEISSMRSTLETISVSPSANLKTLDDRVDVLRKDVLQLFDAVAQVQLLETRLLARARDEARGAVEGAKVDIAREVSAQIRAFDDALRHLRRDGDIPRTVPLDAEIFPPTSAIARDQQPPQKASRRSSSAASGGVGLVMPTPSQARLIQHQYAAPSGLTTSSIAGGPADPLQGAFDF